MAFVSTLTEEWEVVETTLRIETNDGEFMTRIPVGYDDVDSRIFSAFVCLATEPGYGDLRYELSFSVVDVIDGEDPEFRMDGLETKPRIPRPEDRAKILNALCHATKRLIDEVDPTEVVMSTREAYLPPKALVKYDRIAAVFKTRGYIAGRSDPHNGRHIWMMVKPAVG